MTVLNSKETFDKTKWSLRQEYKRGREKHARIEIASLIELAYVYEEPKHFSMREL